MLTFWNYKSPLGSFTLQCEDEALCALKFGKQVLEGEYRPSITSNRAAQQVLEYFAGRRKTFDVPYVLQCTKEKKFIYQKFCLIPYGSTLSYEDFLACFSIQSSKRLLISCCKENPLPLILPSHRICAQHSLGIYCASPEAKQYFIALERSVCKGNTQASINEASCLSNKKMSTHAMRVSR